MAIARGAGTEIIRTASFEDIVNNAASKNTLIMGEQHHIYTVLSVIIYCVSVASTKSTAYMHLIGYDANGCDSGQNIQILEQPMSATETFVWNDRFSFNGTEPTDSLTTPGIDSAADQDLIADQATTTPQQLVFYSAASSETFDVSITYIDQNNS